MQKWIGKFHRWAMQFASLLRPLVNHLVERAEANAPYVRQKLTVFWDWFRGQGASTSPMSYPWRENFWRPLGDWLTNVTWKRFIVVGILLFIVFGIGTTALDSAFSSKELVTVHDQADKPKSGSNDTQVSVNTKGVVITDQAAGKTVTIGFDGIRVQSKEVDTEGSNTSETRPVEVTAAGVIVTDPDTGKRFRLGAQGVVPVDEVAPASAAGASSAASKPQAIASSRRPYQPSEPASPTPAPPVPPVAPETSKPTDTSLPEVRVKVEENADRSYTLVAGPIRWKLHKNASQAEVAEAMTEIREAAQEVLTNAKEAQREAQRELELARQAEQEAREEAERARREFEREVEQHAEKAAKPGRVITVNKPAGIGDVLMPLLTALLFAAVLAKVILNTRSKAAAKVAEARMETEREALERQLAEAKFATMQAQVEPHFLFNTLGSVEYLIEADPKRAAQMQRSLIAYLRAAMPHLRDTTSNMGREAQLIQSYLEILAFRMEERLVFSVDVPSGLHSAEIPPMMLLSLVENCIKHGLEPKPEGGSIELKAEIADARLRVTVADTGMGYNPSGAATSGTGVGLSNIRERLKALYQGAASLQIGANDPAGTRVVIELPYKVTSNLKT